jgi:hypothetical protein
VSASENRTPPEVESTDTSSATARTAANPTPNRPTTPMPAWPCGALLGATVGPPSRLADARIDASDATPASSRGSPVFAAMSTSPSGVDASLSSNRPGTPARVAASAAFWASSTSTRSR